MKKLFNWNFASILAIIFGIIGGVYLIYQLINHFTSEKIKLKSEVSIINYEVPPDKATTSYWRELREIITSDFDSYYLSRYISDSLYEKVDLSSINKSVIRENIESALPETFNREQLVDRLDTLLLIATYPMSSSKYFVSTFINNKGSKICKEMRFEIPTHGYYELFINDNFISKGNFKNNINIGELRPENIATLKIWAFEYVSDYQLSQNEIKYTFDNGHIAPTLVDTIVAKGFFYWLYKNTIWAIYLLIFLPLYMTFMVMSNIKSEKNKDEEIEKQPITKNIVHLADSAKNENDSNKETEN